MPLIPVLSYRIETSAVSGPSASSSGVPSVSILLQRGGSFESLPIASATEFMSICALIQAPGYLSFDSDQQILQKTSDAPDGAGLGGWLRKHSRTLQSLGILTVLLTFIVRDVLREPVKDSTGSLSAARSVFAVRNDLAEIKEQLEGITGQPTERTSGSEKAVEAKVRADMVLLSESVYVTKASAESLCNLTKTMSNSADQKTACDLIESSKTLAKDIAEGRATIETLRGADERVAFYGRLADRSYKVALAVSMFGLSFIEHADKEQEEKEGKYRFLTYVYYGLFGIGLALGAVGTLFGIKGLDGGG
jgi:hypothetical protein